MGSLEPREERCGAKLRSKSDDGEQLYCEQYPCGCGKDRCNGQENGRCRLHGAHTGNNGRTDDDLPTENYKHGLTANFRTYYDQQDKRDKDFIDAMEASMMRRAPFDEDDADLHIRVKQVAVDLHKEMRANSMLSDDLGKDQVVGVNDAGEPIWREDEHYINKTYSRIKKDIRSEMKDLDLLPTNDTEEAAQTFAQMMKEIAEE